MTGQLICRVKPSTPWLVIGFSLFASMGIATAPHWSSRAFYPWERLDISWIMGAVASAIVMVLAIPDYLLRLRASNGWGVWLDDGSLFLMSRKKPMPLREIDRVWIRDKLFSNVMVALKDGKSVRIPVWAMDINAVALAAQIEEARQTVRDGEPSPLS